MKKFIVMGNGDAVTYKDVFPLIKDRKIILGATKKIGSKGGSLWFEVPDHYTGDGVRVIDGKRCICVSSACWFTNIEHHCYDKLVLTRKFDDTYKHYDNYDAIDCKTRDIPYDYDGVVGVPITFLDKWDGEGFEVLYCWHGVMDKDAKYDIHSVPMVDGKPLYARILIKKKVEFEVVGFCNNVLFMGDYECYSIVDGKPTFGRILIRRKNLEK